MKLWSRISSEICMRNKSDELFQGDTLRFVVTLALLGVGFAQSGYYRHIVFDNSITPDFYYYSGAGEVKPSSVEKISERLPVETKFFRTPPNALRVEWQSNAGGVWGAEVRLLNFRNRLPGVNGTSLYIWCYAPQAIAAADLPMLVLSNRAEGLQVAEFPGSFTAPVPLGKYAGDMPAGKWMQVRIPLKDLQAAVDLPVPSGRAAQRDFSPGTKRME